MFENETKVVQLDIDFLRELVAKDYKQDPTFDSNDLLEKLVSIKQDIDVLQRELPYEDIDDLVEAREDLGDELLEEDELEDEIVHNDKLILEAQSLWKQVYELYFGVNGNTIQESKPVEKSGRKYRRSEDSRFRLSVAILFALICIVWIIFGD